MDKRTVLLALEKTYSKPEYLGTDPVELPLRYATREERELKGLLCALFAYGNVKSMRAFLESLFQTEAAAAKPGKKASSLPYYRFQTGSDVAAAIHAVQTVHEREGTFEGYFQKDNLREGISSLQRDLLKACRHKTRGLVHLFGDPEAASARKRFCMFLRWMVREGFPDFGLYRSVPASRLVVPLDTHMIHMADNLGLVKISSPSFKAAEALTEVFRRIDPGDPLRFDFALTRPGIAGICRSRFLPSCESCAVKSICRIYGAGRQKE